ncbi:MAG: hypothetical protein HYR91_12400 [Flavobacteriia bacterium]|nr:hypothetical protein [Flavobacteriia bacterium]
MLTKFLSFFILILTLLSCTKDQGKNPSIQFINALDYISSNEAMEPGQAFKIGVNTFKAETHVSLKTFKVTKSINNGEAEEVFSKRLRNTEKDDYNYLLQGNVGSTSGQTEKYTFTVTNRYGTTNQVSLTLSIL